MKRSSFVCLDAHGGKDSLVYQEIPGREGGEEFFLFFAPGAPGQAELLRTLFREAVSASRLGAPLHYFAAFLERFGRAAASAPPDEDPIAGALLMIEIRRGDDAYLLCNRDAHLVHWNGATASPAPLGDVPGLRELPLGGGEQRDLFARSPEDLFVLREFATTGSHTLALLPGRDFAERHAETLRNSIFFPSFEVPQESGLSLPVERSFPALHWRGSRSEDVRPTAARSTPRAGSRRIPVAAGAAAGIIALAAIIAIRSAGDRAAKVGADRPNLVAADAPRGGEAEGGAPEEERAAPMEKVRPGAALPESWVKSFRGAITSSPRCAGGAVFFGCRDGYLYAFEAGGELRWKYRASGGIGASPLVLDDRIVCADYSGNLFCLDSKKGKLVWTLPLRVKIVSSPVAIGDRVCVATTGGKVVAAKIRDGKKLWEKKIGASIRSTPAAGKDFLVAATTDGSLARLSADGVVAWKAALGGEILSGPVAIEERDIVVLGTPGRSIQARSLSTGALVWKHATDAAVTGSPLLEGESIYVGTRGGSFYALSLDGVERWRANAGGAVLSKPAIAGGTIFVTTYGAHLVAFDATTGSVVGRYRADSEIYSSPGVDAARIYFGSNGGVFHALWLVPPA